MSDELKPCPHCGNGSLLMIARRASIYPLPDVKVFEGRVLCEECGGAMLLSHKTRDDTPDETGVSELREILRERWNARAERTCRIVETKDRDGSGRPYGISLRCSACNRQLKKNLVTSWRGISYCYYCGAKVVAE